jgi:hypothetical protein
MTRRRLTRVTPQTNENDLQEIMNATESPGLGEVAGTPEKPFSVPESPAIGSTTVETQEILPQNLASDALEVDTTERQLDTQSGGGLSGAYNVVNNVLSFLPTDSQGIVIAETGERKRKRYQNSVLSALVRAGHVFTFFAVDPGTLMFFERTVKSLHESRFLSDSTVSQIAQYLLFTKSEFPSLPSIIPSPPELGDRWFWLRDTKDGKHFREAVVAARQVSLRLARDAMEAEFLVVVGQDRCRWAVFFQEYDIQYRLLNCELQCFFVSHNSDNDEYRRGLEILRILNAGVHALARKSMKDGSISILMESDLAGTCLLLDLLSDARNSVFNLKRNVCLAFQGLCIMLLFFISQRAQQYSSCLEPETTVCSNNPSTPEPEKVAPNEDVCRTSPPLRSGKRVKKDFPFDADFACSDLSEDFRRRNVGTEFSVFLMGKLSRMRQDETYTRAVSRHVSYILQGKPRMTSKRIRVSETGPRFSTTTLEPENEETIIAGFYHAR